MNCSDTECQPCDQFDAGENSLYNVHECIHCDGTVRFCDHCHRDHHEGGYNTCAIEKVAKCRHPACVARVKGVA